MASSQALKYLNICNDDLCHQTIGIKASRVDKKVAKTILTLAPWHMNYEKCAHGGILFSLMDTTMGLCVYPHLSPQERILAVDLKINYLKPALLSMKKISCCGMLVSRTRRLAVSEGEILSPSGDILCKALGTFAILNNSR